MAACSGLCPEPEVVEARASTSCGAGRSLERHWSTKCSVRGTTSDTRNQARCTRSCISRSGPSAPSEIGQERAVTDSRGHVSGDRAYHAMGVSASAWRTTGQHRQLVRRVDPSRIVAVSNARPDTSDATAGAISSLWHLGRVRTPSFRTLKVGSRTEDPRRRQSSPHAVGNVPRRPTQERSTRAPTLPFLAVVPSGRLSLPPSQRSSPSES
jgi:hypothetical protein